MYLENGVARVGMFGPWAENVLGPEEYLALGLVRATQEGFDAGLLATVNEEERNKILWKEQHTLRVVKWSLDIWQLMGRRDGMGLSELMVMAGYHDRGRVGQILKQGVISDERSGMDHALLSRIMLEEKGNGRLSQVLLAAVEDHSKFQPERDTFLALIIRDADKAANLEVFGRWMKRIVNGQILRTGNGWMVDQLANRQQPDYVGKMMDPRVLVLGSVGWLFDINFKETKFMLMKRGIPAMMVKELRQQPWMDAKVMDEVEEVVKWWEKEYQCPVA